MVVRLTPIRLQPDLPKAADTGQPIRMIHPTMCGVELPRKSRRAGEAQCSQRLGTAWFMWLAATVEAATDPAQRAMRPRGRRGR